MCEMLNYYNEKKINILQINRYNSYHIIQEKFKFALIIISSSI